MGCTRLKACAISRVKRSREALRGGTGEMECYVQDL